MSEPQLFFHDSWLTALDRLKALPKELPRPGKIRAHLTPPFPVIEFPPEGQSKSTLSELFAHVQAQAESVKDIARIKTIELDFGVWKLTLTFHPGKVSEITAVPKTQPGPGLDPTQVTPWFRALVTALQAHPERTLGRSAIADEPEGKALWELQIEAARRAEERASQEFEKLANENRKREQAYDDKVAKYEAENAREKARLAEERTRLDNEKTERDSRQATIVRREIHGKLEKAFGPQTDPDGKPTPHAILSPATEAKRGPIRIALGLFVLLGCVLLAYPLVFEFSKGQPPSLARALQIAGGLIVASSVWFFVRWQEQWQQLHAEVELQRHKDQMDNLRVGWLAEFFIETKDEKIPIPESLQAGMSRGLFMPHRGLAVTEHPIETVLRGIDVKRLRLRNGKGGVFDVEKMSNRHDAKQ
jgi:hypothetical protein